MKNRVWKYCRQAGYDGDDSGIQAQEFRINEYISKHELIPVGESKVFESGTTMDRPSLHELMQKRRNRRMTFWWCLLLTVWGGTSGSLWDL